MTDKKTKCTRCNSESDINSRFCSLCGLDLEYQNKINSRKKIKISVSWILFAVISIFVFEYICANITGQLFILLSGNTELEFETSILISSIGSLIGIYSGTLFSAYMSPGLSLKEPLIGAAIEILTSQVILFFMAGTFSYLFIIRTVIIMSVGAAGAKSGSIMKKRKLRLQ